MTDDGNTDTTRVLIIDDDRKLCTLVAEYLAPFGYEVQAAYTGPDGLDQAQIGDFRAVILDVMLPGMDGFEVLKKLRTVSAVPVLMLTSRGDETDRIVGLELGADDYLPKTFSTRELLARLRAVTRRSLVTRNEQTTADAEPTTNRTADADSPLLCGELCIDHISHTVTIADQVLALTPLEYELLLCLVRAAGRVLSRDQLLDAIDGNAGTHIVP